MLKEPGYFPRFLGEQMKQDSYFLPQSITLSLGMLPFLIDSLNLDEVTWMILCLNTDYTDYVANMFNDNITRI